jgi:hypothetical protein
MRLENTPRLGRDQDRRSNTGTHQSAQRIHTNLQ